MTPPDLEAIRKRLRKRERQSAGRLPAFGQPCICGEKTWPLTPEQMLP